MAVYNSNLVLNPGAEDGGPTPIPNWTTSGPFEELTYGGNATASAGSGDQLFEGGNGSAQSSAFQDISLADLGADINTGMVSAVLSGELGGYQAQNDFMTLSVTWLDASGNPLGTLNTPNVSAADRGNQSIVLPVSMSGSVPQGAVTARVAMVATRTDGNFNNGYADNISLVLTPPVCFTTGTLIRTERGDVAVEDLQVGDLAVTATGALRQITWIGHRHIGGAGCKLPHDQQPIRVRRGAFDHDLPARDLYLSPGHPVLVGADAANEGGMLVPVMCLINGTTIERVAVETITYWHVELDSHDILMAENLPAESYLDWGDRAFFTEGSDHALADPDFFVPGLAGRCRPVAVDGPVVEAARRRLDTAFASRLDAACAWPASETDIRAFFSHAHSD